jgi:formate hydrogenlyase subunit 6/NADH:ubiquinone oxidoreductase subunit I
MTQYFQNIFQAVASIPASMAVSWKAFTEKPVTLEYPDVKWKLPERARAQLYNNVDDCIGCNKCAHACPVDCIHIETMKAGPDENLGMTSKNTPKRLHVLVFDIDMAKCCYCNLCTYPCPTECLVMTPNYEASTFDRYDLVYHFAAYTPDEARTLVGKAREREGDKLKINVVPEKLSAIFREKRGSSATEPNVKPYAGSVPKPAPKPVPPKPQAAATPGAPPPSGANPEAGPSDAPPTAPGAGTALAEPPPARPIAPKVATKPAPPAEGSTPKETE